MQLHRYESELAEIGAAVVVMTFQAGPVVEAYVRESGLPWPILIDESRAVYSAYGMNRGSHWNVYGPATMWEYAKLMLRGRRPTIPEKSDYRQLGGDVIIDPAGIVKLHHIGNGPADRPKPRTLIDFIHNSNQP